ncbi:AbrB/MazE/SpoVT family DNA-binding domain-containing protein [Saccharolobus shibatae]|uniref:SpoVT-AbrB domain-containing protein n=1 Tax=Saccharolobus shibatae TaxID=2286 RepID=A0A8F5C181_9CREN|nr:AbrB/MazE/SpoVT family DNA-binding domain-containing protein [Saccharolobus shibatae]QXJ32190.1 hypothetical protein J5U21_01841 [Saccharolobus shibatae]QXJ35202.1 hypothetical protein J5U22_01749 [Saccharolobus shibatae]
MVKVTEKFQVTIPKEVREKINLKPNEEFEVIALNDNEILLRSFRYKNLSMKNRA